MDNGEGLIEMVGWIWVKCWWGYWEGLGLLLLFELSRASLIVFSVLSFLFFIFTTTLSTP